MFIKINTI